MKASGLEDSQLVELESFGLITIRGRHYDSDSLSVAKAVAEMAGFGIEPRHLRSFKSAADREIGLIEQVITPFTRQKSTEARLVPRKFRKRLHLSRSAFTQLLSAVDLTVFVNRFF